MNEDRHENRIDGTSGKEADVDAAVEGASNLTDAETQENEFTSGGLGAAARRFLKPEDIDPIGTFADWPVWLVSGTTFFAGLVGTVQPLLVRFEKHPKLFSALVPFELYHFSKTVELGFAILLIYLSFNLWRRKRTAWWLAVLINGLSATLQLLRIGGEHSVWLADKMSGIDLPSYSAVPPILGCGFLLILQNHFRVKSESKSVRFALLTSLILIVVAIGYGALGFWLIDKIDFGVSFNFRSCLERSISGITQFGNADLTARTRYARWFIESLQVVGYIVPTIIIFSLFRPINYQLNTHPRERHQAEDILNKYGRTSLDRYKLLHDKSYLFSQDGLSFVAYKTEGSTAISLGDPVGPPEKITDMTKRFLNYCHENGWNCAFMQVPADFLPIYEELKLDTLKIGEDGVVDLKKFCAETANKKTFKSPVKKFDRDGYKVLRSDAPHSDEELAELKTVSDEWLSLPGRRERGFSLGKFDKSELRHETVFKLVDPNGKILAFANQVRSYQAGEVTIDLMRHRVEVPNGAMDFLFVKMMLLLHEEGFTHFSLGLAALSGVGTESNATLQERAVHQIYEHMNRFFSYKGLRNYKAKFAPEWVSRYLVYEGGAPGLVRTTIAIAKATED